MSIHPIEDLLKSPRLPAYIEQLKGLWAEEQTRRRAFRDGLTDDQKSEFINGEICVHSPAKKRHLDSVQWITGVISAYVAANKLGVVFSEKALIGLDRNDYEPDVCFFGQEKSKSFKADQMVFPAPDLIVEVVSESTELRDRGVKFTDYALHGVGEYWIVDPEKQFIEQYMLMGEEYILREKLTEGHVKSDAIRWLRFPVRAAFDETANLEALKEILAAD